MTASDTPSYGELSSKEWLVTNGLGGYASSTVCGANTRRYHGLLVSSTNPPTGRRVQVSKVDEKIFPDITALALSTNEYAGGIHPSGYEYITRFDRDPLPCVHFSQGVMALRKTTFMVHGSNTTVIEYTNTGPAGYNIWLNPLYVDRDYHTLLHERPDYDFYTAQHPGYQAVYAYHGAAPVFFGYTAGRFTQGHTWHRSLKYREEELRGQDYLEDIYSTGFVEQLLQPGESMYLVFSLDEAMMTADPAGLKEAECTRIKNLVPKNITNQFLADLVVCSDQFMVQRRSTGSYSILAGYHWFTDWGRDAMIALRGYIAAGRQTESAAVITTFLDHLRQGIIPNRFADDPGEEPEYHTIDASLWLFIAVYDYDLRFGDTTFLQRVFPQLTEIIASYARGTKHNIHLTVNGLLCGGTPGLPLTWMDARIGNHVFTPRKGCPVEINALWFNALKIHQHAATRLGLEPNRQFIQLADKLENEFVKSFWNHNGYLNDTVTPAYETDGSMRPNQIYVVSLPFPLLPREKEMQVVTAVAEKLLTPFGLRTLATDHPFYKGVYEGDVWSRDEAYHQGTVWPFLGAEYYMAYLKVNGFSAEAKKKVWMQLQPLADHFYNRDCLLGISEIFDGTNPLQGKGCANQAWSVCSLIWLIVEGGLVD